MFTAHTAFPGGVIVGSDSWTEQQSAGDVGMRKYGFVYSSIP